MNETNKIVSTSSTTANNNIESSQTKQSLLPNPLQIKIEAALKSNNAADSCDLCRQ